MDAGFEVYWNTEKCFVLASSIGLEEFITCLRSRNEAEIILQCKEGKDEIPSFPISKIVRNQCQFSREQRRRSCKCQLDWWKLLCCGGGSYYICVIIELWDLLKAFQNIFKDDFWYLHFYLMVVESLFRIGWPIRGGDWSSDYEMNQAHLSHSPSSALWSL